MSLKLYLILRKQWNIGNFIFHSYKKKLTSKIHSLVRYSENRDRYAFTTEFLHASIFKID